MSLTKLRMTPQRQLILQELRNSKAHPTADYIYLKVRKAIPNISLGTVYRNLDILSEMGLVLKMEGCGSQRRYDGNPLNHCHVRCLKCGKVDDIPDGSVAEIDCDSVDIPGYTIVGHSIFFDGLCNACIGYIIK